MSKQIHTTARGCAAIAILTAGIALAHAEALAPGQKLSKEPTSVFALTADHELIRFDPADPAKILHRVKITGLAAGEHLHGIDYRVHRGVMYALGDTGNLYTVDTTSGKLTRIGAAPLAVELPKGRFGFDFNPAADRIRVVSESAMNLRLHPDTGSAVDFKPDQEGLQQDGTLTYAAGDRFEGQPPAITAAAYTYNADNEKLTTNYAIDRVRGTLAMQGTREGKQPAVSPNLGVLTTVGELGTGPLDDAHFDISDVSNTAFAALTPAGDGATRLYRVDLENGKASAVGAIGDGSPLRGLAIEP